jgi:hypothetical protein
LAKREAAHLSEHLARLKAHKVWEYKRKLVECFYRLERWQTTGGIEEAEKARQRAEIAADYVPDIVADAQARVDAGCWCRGYDEWWANGKRWINPRGSIDA